MQYCDKCKVTVAGNRKFCPLCQRELTKLNEDKTEIFPIVPNIYKEHSLLFQILIFSSIVVGVISLAVNFLLPTEVWWSLFVVAGIVCMWISLAVAVKKRRNIPKNMCYQVVLISLIGLLFDWLTGWHGWSLDFVIPIASMAAVLALSVVSRVLRLRLEDYVVYMLIDGLFVIAPLLLLLFGKLSTVLPSLICITEGIISIAGLLIFRGEQLLAELKKRLHI